LSYLLGGEYCPIPVRRGIRQGCPISGQLYSLFIKPLSIKLGNNLKGFHIQGDFNGSSVSVSAYADVVTVFITGQGDIQILSKSITGQGDIQILSKSLAVYERASSWKVNWAKSEGFLVGPWRNGGPPKLPGGLQWNIEGIKILGVFLGKENYRQKTGRECWRRCQPSCLNGNGYYLNYPIGVESWLQITWPPPCYGTG